MSEVSLDSVIRQVTLDRLRACGAHRARTATSLGIGVRTLGIWLERWRKEGKIKFPLTTESTAESTAESLMRYQEPESKVSKSLATEKTVTEGGHPPLTKLDVTTEAWREYEWTDPVTGKLAVARFENPIAVYVYKGCTTHRVVHQREGKDVTTLVPSIGYYGCKVTFGAKDGQPAVAF